MKKLLFLLLTTATVLFILFPALAKAAVDEEGIIQRPLKGSDCLYKGGDGNPEVTVAQGRVVTLDCVPIVFFNIVFWLLVFAGVIALIFIIFGGIKLTTSGGDPKQTEGARKTLTWAVVGLMVVLLSFGIVRFVSDITGVACIRKFGFEACQKPQCTLDSDCSNPRHYCDRDAGVCKNR